MKKMAASDVLIVGMKGLGVEIGESTSAHCRRQIAHVFSQERRSRGCQVGNDIRPQCSRDRRSRYTGKQSICPLHVQAHPQFFLREADVGKSRASVTAPRLSELNSYVPISVLEGEGDITPEKVAPFQVSSLAFISLVTSSSNEVVVLTNATVAKQVEIDEFARSKGIYFIAADVRGLFG